MNEEHQGSLKQYVNDVIALEREISQAVRVQKEDDAIAKLPGLRTILQEIVTGSEARIEALKVLSEEEGATIGGALKEGITAVVGVLAGVYGKVREHPVSRMVRDDIIAMDVAMTSYGMLLTLGTAIGHKKCADLATTGLNACPGLIIRLTDMLPAIICEELAKDAPLADPLAANKACTLIREAWKTNR